MGTPWWRPKNDVERALLAALAGGDYPGYFRIIQSARLHVPREPDDEPDGFSPVTLPFQGELYLLAFTSEEGMRTLVGDTDTGHLTLSYAQLRDRWPDRRWRLAINPGLPIGAYLPVEAVDRVVRGELAVADGYLVAAGPAGEEPGRAYPRQVFDPALLATAGQEIDEDLDALLGATVFVPTNWQVREPLELVEADLPLRLTGVPGAPTIEVFTTTRAVAAAHPDLPYVALPFDLLLALLPERAGLVVDPGQPGERELRDERLAQLAVRAAEQTTTGERSLTPDELLDLVRGAPPPGPPGPAAV